MKYCNSCEIPIRPIRKTGIRIWLKGKLMLEQCPRCFEHNLAPLEKWVSSRTFNCAHPTSHQIIDERNAIDKLTQ